MQKLKMKKKYALNLWHLTLLVVIGVVISIGLQVFKPFSDRNRSDVLENIKRQGVLRVLTRNMSTSYYDHHDLPAGTEYDIAKSFSEHLGVRLEVVVKGSISELFSAMEANEGDIIAAGITRTENREERYRFGPDYQSIQQQVICSGKHKLPERPADLENRSIAVIADSSYEETLKNWAQTFPSLTWKTSDYHSTEQIIEHIVQGDVDCTIADSNIVSINRRYYPRLQIAFAASEPQQLAWVIPENADELSKKLDRWFKQSLKTGKIASVLEKYYGHVDLYEHYDLQVFRQRIDKRLPKYQSKFENAAAVINIPWTLLAAQAYQESHWDPKAKSPTGVRGIMMLTQNRAKSMGVSDRLNPRQSIMGGARYLKKMIDRLPDSVVGDDRQLLGLAAYNLGMGHLQDARRLAESLHKNPDSWMELKTVLPLLSVKAYYQTLKHGYARGNEPVRYIEQIKNYEDVLKKELGM